MYILKIIFLDGVVDMDVGYKASYPGSKNYSGVFISYANRSKLTFLGKSVKNGQLYHFLDVRKS